MSDESTAPDPLSPPPTPSRLRWLRQRFPKLPVWAWVIIVLVIIGAATSAGSSSDDDSDVMRGDEAAPTTYAPTTTEGATTTETPTLSAGDKRDLEILYRYLVFQKGDERINVIEEMEDNFIHMRVDVFTVDVSSEPGANYLRVEGSSGYQTAEFQIQKVWELVDYLVGLWTSDGFFRNDEGSLKTGLWVVLDGRQYLADYALMVRAAERDVKPYEWLNLASRN